MPWEGQSLDPSETLALRLSNTAVLASTPASSALATVTAQGSTASGRSPAAAHILQCQCPGRLLGTADTSACQARNTTFTSPTCSMLANGSSMDACRRFVDHAGARHMTTPCSGWRPSLPNSAGVPCAEYQPDGRRPGWNSSAKAASNDVALSLSDANRQESLQEMRQRFMSRLQQVGGDGRSTSVGRPGGYHVPALHSAKGRGFYLPQGCWWCLHVLCQGQVACTPFLRQSFSVACSRCDGGTSLGLPGRALHMLGASWSVGCVVPSLGSACCLLRAPATRSSVTLACQRQAAF